MQKHKLQVFWFRFESCTLSWGPWFSGYIECIRFNWDVQLSRRLNDHEWSVFLMSPRSSKIMCNPRCCSQVEADREQCERDPRSCGKCIATPWQTLVQKKTTKCIANAISMQVFNLENHPKIRNIFRCGCEILGKPVIFGGVAARRPESHLPISLVMFVNGRVPLNTLLVNSLKWTWTIWNWNPCFSFWWKLFL